MGGHGFMFRRRNLDMTCKASQLEQQTDIICYGLKYNACLTDGISSIQWVPTMALFIHI